MKTGNGGSENGFDNGMQGNDMVPPSQPPIPSQGAPDGGMPPMDAPMPDGGMGAEPPMPDGGGDDDQFDHNFDAGVEADENSDPKRYIEQLCGKLSQKLNQYVGDNPDTASETCKYVLGMVSKSAGKGLDENSLNDIIEKLKSSASEGDSEEPEPEEGEGEPEEEEPMQDMPEDGQEPMPEDGNQQPMNESFLCRVMSLMEEVSPVGITDSESEEDRKELPKKKKTAKKSAFSVGK